MKKQQRFDGQTDGQTDGQIDGQTDGRTDGQTDGQMHKVNYRKSLQLQTLGLNHPLLEGGRGHWTVYYTGTQSFITT